MARNRQRAKQRQQQRREERLRERQGQQGDGKADGDDPAEVGQVAGETGAPPENLGRSDSAADVPGDRFDDVASGGRTRGPRDAEPRPELSEEEEEELFLDEEDFEVDQEELADAEAAEGYAPRGRRGDREAGEGDAREKRGDRTAASGEPTGATGLARVVAFLRACWAELQRVQWPDRRQTTQLTAIVLVFILIMGGYLGLLDQIVSRVVQEII
ncbi:MAG TPA: preprotein translocase subunit SecE [Solirubrobacterales bacterium]|nr:preprotein translocase subunit SecE [Solirubrobacterales bacterium]